MGIEYKDPPMDIATSSSDTVHCTSDIHMGNQRPTNDLTRDELQKFKIYLRNLETTISTGNTYAFDLVLNGDTFDFWKAIPEPLPSENVYPVHSDEDIELRFNQILEYNSDVLFHLAKIVLNMTDQKGAKLFITNGNHDDYFEGSFLTRARHILYTKLAEIAVANGLANDESQYYNEMITRVTFCSIYQNSRVGVHIQHGHRWDEHNVRRRDNVTNEEYLSEGQILVEYLVNGLHDLNLNTMGYKWEKYMQKEPGLKQALKWLDNFTDHLDAERYIVRAAGNLDDEVEEVFRRQSLAALWNVFGRELIVDLASIPLFGKAVEWFYFAIKRLFEKDKLKNAAEDILNGTSGSANVRPKIVLLGHSHIFDQEPAPSHTPVNSKYLNTGTWVEVLRYNNQDPLNPTKLNYAKPVMLQRVDGPPPKTQMYLVEPTTIDWINDILLT